MTLLPQVLECVLQDFDVCYAPFLASYGSCPATLEYCPGATTSIWITFLTPELAQDMHATE